MKTTIKILALILALVMMLPLVLACKDNSTSEDGADSTTAQQGGPGGTVDTSDQAVSKLPSMDWNGETFDILGRDGGSYVMFHNFEIWRESMPGDVVGDAVFTRNETLKKKYNFEVTEELVSNTYTEIQTLYDAQDDIYDLVIYRPINVQAHASAGYLLDLNSADMQYINFEHPSWNDHTNEQLTIAGRLFYTSSDFLLQDKSRTFCMFYNRELARANSLGYLEDLVKNNTWTLETVNNIVHDFAVELDGLSGHSPQDGFGIATTGTSSFAAFCYGAGFRLSQNTDGYPTLVEPSTFELGIIDAVGKFAFDNTVWYEPGFYKESDSTVFCNGNTLLYSVFPSVLESAMNEKCTFEFGSIPYPKYDASQERYLTQINVENGSLFAIPYTVADPAMVSFFLQAITEESTNTSYTAFIDTKCKIQDVYDERSAEMLDLTLQNVAYDVVAICGYGDLWNVIANLIPGFGTNIYKRLWDQRYEKAESAIDDLVADYEAM